MNEWHTATYSDQFPQPPLKKPGRFRALWRWLPVVVVIPALLIVGRMILDRQHQERRAAMRDDLTAFILAEESARSLGQPDQAPAFIIPNAPPEWQSAYRQSFGPPGLASPPGAVAVKAIEEFDGHCALITVDLDHQAQLRAYCLNDRQWARAPLSTRLWGERQTFLELSHGVRLGFWPRDAAFATTLAGELPQLLDRLAGWAGQPGAAASAQAAAYAGLDILIEPHELAGPLVSEDRRRIVLNSPWLAPFSGDGLSGQEAVRLALAEALLRRTGLAPAETPPPLPGLARFTAAAQTVIALHLVMPAEVQAHLVNQWRAQLAGQWTSPFFAELISPADPVVARQAGLAANLTAEYLYAQGGRDLLASLLPPSPAIDSWDSLFQTRLHRSTTDLENEVAAYARGDSAPAPGQPPALPGFPLQVTLLAVHNQAGGPVAVVSLTDQSNPVLVELSPELSFQTAGVAALPPACIPPGTGLSLAGRWLEAGRRIQASQATVQRLTLPAVGLAPADTSAYLVQGELSIEEQALAIEGGFPNPHQYLADSQAPAPRTFVALSSDGAIQPLSVISSTFQVRPLPVAAGGSSHFLFILDLPGCDRSWFIHYQPQTGLTGSWLGPPQPARWVWRTDRQNLLFFRSSGRAGFEIYEPAESLSLRPLGSAPIPVLFIGWQVSTGQLIFIRFWKETAGIGLLEPSLADLGPVKVYSHPLRARRLSPDGNWLAYLVGAQNLFDPPYKLDLLNLATLVDTNLIQVAEGQGLMPPVWSPYPAQLSLAVLAGPLAGRQLLQPNRLLVAAPGRPGSYLTVAEAAPGERLAAPVFCADGGLLYRVDQDGRYRLLRSRPGLPPVTLLSQDQPFVPLACP